MGVTAFAAVLHPRYVLQQNLSDIFTFMPKIALIKIASIRVIWLCVIYGSALALCLPHWIDLKITGCVSEAAEAPRLC